MNSRSMREIPIDLIDPDPNQSRKKFAGLKSMQAIVVEGPQEQHADLLEAQITLNVHRESLNPMDLAFAIDRLIKLSGKPASEVSTRLGMSPAQVSKLLTLLLLPSDAQTLIASGRLAASSGYVIAKVADPGEREKLIAEATAGGLTREGLTAKAKALVKPAKPRQRLRTRLRKLRMVFPLAADCSVTVSSAELTIDKVIAWIGELFAQLTSAHSEGLALADFVKELSAKRSTT